MYAAVASPASPSSEALRYRQGFSRRQTFAQAVISRRSHRRLWPSRPTGLEKPPPAPILLTR